MSTLGPIQVVSLYVTDQEQALEFYTDVLGMECRRNEPMSETSRWIEVAPPGAETTIVLYPRSEEPSWEEHKPSLVFHSDDTEALIDTLQAKGVTIPMEPTDYPWGTFAQIEDPDGNRLSVRTPAKE